MTCYRIAHPDHSSNEALLNGKGAEESGGRWNEIGSPAIYSCSNVETCVSEKGYYSIINKIDLTKHSKSKPLYDTSLKKGISFVLAEILLSPLVILEDLTTPATLSNALAEAGLQQHSIADSRVSCYEDLPHNWTQKLGAHLSRKGFKGLRVKSARSNQGDVIVLFPSNLDSTDRSIGEKWVIKLQAVDSQGGSISKKRPPVRDKVKYEYSIKAGIVDVLEFL